MKICLQPYPEKVRPNNGIGRVVYAQHEHLPAFGFEFVSDPAQADLCVGHTQQFDMPRMDVLHVHGLYWIGDLDSGTYTTWHVDANDKIVEAVRKARSITVPSQWVAMPFKRDMRISPTVIGHGINFADWQPARNDGYVLWGKNRIDDVCKPDAPYEMARRGVKVLSTFAPDGVSIPNNMQIVGVQTSTLMHEIISHAGVYLATVKETFGIQTLEAMACGVPVVGWNCGGTADIVTSGVDGLLVKPGDYDALHAAIKEATHRRAELGKAARETASRYDWPLVMRQYAELYQRTYDEMQHEQHGVSVIITTHNYAGYVCDAIDSALNQTRKPDEVIVVDDGSTDNTPEVLIERYEGREFENRVLFLRQENKGVAAARALGLEHARQTFVALLDADDKLAPTFIETLLPPLIKERDLGVAYSGLTLFNEKDHWLSNGFPPPFDWELQATPSNPPSDCVPSACLFRREMWLRAGPHKQEYAPGEDAEFWTRALSVGFMARKVTDAGLFWYRLHSESASRRLKYKRIDDRLPWMRDKRYPLAAPSRYAPLVMSYSEPRVSIIVAVDDATVNNLPDCIDSVTGQTMREWELIIVKNYDPTVGGTTSGNIERRYPFATWLESNGKSNIGTAFNIGLTEAKADLVLPMTAADMLTNSALEEMCQAHVNSGGRYIYTDRIVITDSGGAVAQGAEDYAQSVWQKPLHGVVALIPTEWARSVAFDETLRTQQISDFYSRMAIAGYCGQRLGRVLCMERNEQAAPPTRAQLVKAQKHLKALERETMASCCGGNAEAVLAAKSAVQSMMTSVVPEGRVRLEFTGHATGAVTFTVNNHQYRAGNNDVDRLIDADKADVPRLLQLGFKQVGIGLSSRQIEVTHTHQPADELPQIAALKAFKEPPMPQPMPEPVRAAAVSVSAPVMKAEPVVTPRKSDDPLLDRSIDELTPEQEAALNAAVNQQVTEVVVTKPKRVRK